MEKLHVKHNKGGFTRRDFLFSFTNKAIAQDDDDYKSSANNFAVAEKSPEMRIGMQVNRGRTKLKVSGSEGIGPLDKTRFDLGIFGQVRSSSDKRVSYGLHLGYTSGGEIEDRKVVTSIEDSIVTIDYLSTIKIEQKSTIDVLGLIAWNDVDWSEGKLSPYIMVGRSSTKIDSKIGTTGLSGRDAGLSILFKDEAKLKGYKLVLGVEGEFSESAVWHLEYNYVDYGDDGYFDHIVPSSIIEGKRTGINFGIAYRF